MQIKRLIHLGSLLSVIPLAGAANQGWMDSTFVCLPPELQVNIARYMLSDDIKRDIFDGKQVFKLYHPCFVNSVEYNSDETSIATAGTDGKIRIWDLQTQLLVHEVNTHKDDVYIAKFCNNKEHIASVDTGGAIRVWNLKTNTLIREFNSHSSPTKSFTCDGKKTRMASVEEDGTVRIWDIETGKQLNKWQHKGLINSITCDELGKYVVSGQMDGTVCIWKQDSGDLVRTLRGHKNYVTSVAINEKKDNIASTSLDKTIRIWDTHAEKELKQLSCPCPKSATFNKTGTQIASASMDNNARLWDIATGKVFQTMPHRAWVNAAVFNQAGMQIATASDDRTVAIWDVKLPYENYYFDLEEATWLYTKYHEIMHTAAQKEKKQGNKSAARISPTRKRDQIIKKLAVEQSIREQYPEILSRLQALKSEKKS